MKISLWTINNGQIPADLALINRFDAATDPGVGDDSGDGYQEGSVWVNVSANRAFTCVDAAAGAAIWALQGTGLSPANAALIALGVAGGYKIARGIHQQAAASDTVVTGLATVVAVVANFRDAPTVNQLLCSATIGNQTGAPAAGSFLLRTYKPTAVNDVTPLAATVFSDNVNFDWIAVGT